MEAHLDRLRAIIGVIVRAREVSVFFLAPVTPSLPALDLTALSIACADSHHVILKGAGREKPQDYQRIDETPPKQKMLRLWPDGTHSLSVLAESLSAMYFHIQLLLNA